MNSLELAKKRAKIEKTKSKRSKLDEHIKAIEYLLFEEKFTLKQIQVFLEEDCNCKVAYSNLHAFCKRRFKTFFSFGVNLTEEEFKNIDFSNEGTSHLIDFANLEEELKKENWTPSGKAHVLMWLGLHATGVRFGKLFNRKRPKKVFDNIVSS